MYRAVLTLLVGLMLSLGGGAKALTFKSDGTVVQSDGTVVQKATPKTQATSRISGSRSNRSDASIWKSISEAFFNSDFKKTAAGIDLTVNDGAVLLTGRVNIPEEKVLATKLAWETIGVKEVVSELQVTNRSSINDVSKDLAASAQLRGKLIADRRVSSLNFSIDVINGTVYLSGVCSDREEMERVVRHARELRFARQVVNYIQLKEDRDQVNINKTTQKAFVSQNLQQSTAIKVQQRDRSNTITKTSVDSFVKESLKHFNILNTVAFEIRRPRTVIFKGRVKTPEELVKASIIGWRHPDVTHVITKDIKIQDLSSIEDFWADSSLESKIHIKLIKDKNVDAKRFGVHVINQKVFLTGRANSITEAEKAIAHARSTFGVNEVENLILLPADGLVDFTTEIAFNLPRFAKPPGRQEYKDKSADIVSGVLQNLAKAQSAAEAAEDASKSADRLTQLLTMNDRAVCAGASQEMNQVSLEQYQEEARKRGIDCPSLGYAYDWRLAPEKEELNLPKGVSGEASNEAIAKLKAERQKRLELEQELAALKAQQEQQQQTITNDNQIPLIDAASQQKDEATVLVYGRATDNVGLGDVQVNNELVQIGSDGSFQTQLYIPPNGLVVEITAYDLKGNKATKTLSLARNRAEDAAEISFAQLQPSLGKRGAINRNAIALIVGVEKYENLPARPAIHADKDAEYFADFAHYKLGVPRNNIIKAINSNARRLDILKALAKVTQLSRENESEVFIFFAGHGLAADDGKDVFLIPYDGDTGSFLAETAITRGEIFEKVERIEPKSVTVFLDACYTGGTRSQNITLVAGKRPVRVEALNQSVPKGFTILSASASDETSMALKAAEHGMFSYFLMKGMEGDADANSDNQITMAEMRDYVKDKVVRQSNFRQTPELQGDADRVLVRFK